MCIRDRLEGERELLVAVDGAFAFEIADAMLVENDALDGQWGHWAISDDAKRKTLSYS